MPAAALLSLFLGAARAQAPADLSAVEKAMSVSATARRLLAQTGDLPWRPAFDFRRRPLMGQWELELDWIVELARADVGLPVDLVETEMVAYQALLDFVLERAAAEKAFEARLRDAARGMEKRDSIPRGGFDRAAHLLGLFREDPDKFYWAVERDVERTRPAVTLTELEDFLEKHEGADLGAGGAQERVPYVRLEGRRYKPDLVAAARLLRPLGGRRRLREAFGAFDSPTRAALLRSRIRAWWIKNGLENEKQRGLY